MLDGPLIKIDLGNASDTVKTFIEKVSEGISGTFRPSQIKKIAKAEADARLIEAEGDVAVSDVYLRAAQRRAHADFRDQTNIEQITLKAISYIPIDAIPENLDTDWIANFFDKCRVISDTEVQEVWSRILAGEAAQPGTFSKHTIRILTDLSRKDAEMLQRFHRFSVSFEGELFPFISHPESPIYAKYGLQFGDIKHMETLGLIMHEGFYTNYYKIKSWPVELDYFGEKYSISSKTDENKLQVPVGHVFYTQAGSQLVSVCQPNPILNTEMREHIKTYMSHTGCELLD